MTTEVTDIVYFIKVVRVENCYKRYLNLEILAQHEYQNECDCLLIAITQQGNCSLTFG